jgi:hypothetical protein
MSRHLEELELSAAVAGLELEREAVDHLASCLSCRQRVRAALELIGERRAELEVNEPDWEAQRNAVLDRLPQGSVVTLRRSTWWRPLLAAAALLALAASALLLLPRPAPQVADRQLPVEQILAEVDATLDGDAIPGFAPLSALVPGVDDDDELRSLFDNGAS